MGKREAPSKTVPEPYVPRSDDGAGYGPCPVCERSFYYASPRRVSLYAASGELAMVVLVCAGHSWEKVMERFPSASALQTPLF